MDKKAEHFADFALRLHLVCDRLGMLPLVVERQRRLGEICGVADAIVEQWLAGAAYPGVAECITLARQADVSLDWLLMGVACLDGRGGQYGSVLASCCKEAVKPYPPWFAWLMEKRMTDYIIIGKGSAGVMATWQGDLALLLSGLSEAIRTEDQSG